MQINVTKMLTVWSESSPSLARLVDGVPRDEQIARGYGHTVAEICRQPETWRTTAAVLHGEAGHRRLPQAPLVLTGSGSSEFVCAALAPTLQSRLGQPVRAVACGELLLSPESFLQADQPATLVSFGRSGNSPESVAVVGLVLERYPRCSQIVVTCNPHGRLATAYDHEPRVRTIILGREVDDESLVMTSSFTNMWLAGRTLDLAADDPAAFGRLAEELARLGENLLEQQLEPLAGMADRAFERALFLGTGAGFGAAREAELKMLEMCGGRVATRSETFLGLRHGPLASVDTNTLVVAFVSSEARRQSFELDLLAELRQKGLGHSFVIAGAGVPGGVAAERDLVVEYAATTDMADGDLVLLHVVIGQVLAFFRCLHVGLRPDAPSTDDVITRVVRPFTMHRS